MLEDDSQPKPNWLETLTTNGLPSILAGPAGRAISRLVGAGVEIPASWLEGVSQARVDKTEARSFVSAAIAKKAAELAVADPAIMERAMHGMLQREYRQQGNREAIAGIAVQELGGAEICDFKEEVSEDWLSKFGTYASDVCSDDLRMLFGKTLASEIEKPNTVSISTLHFTSMLDPESTALIQRVLGFVDSHGMFYQEMLDPALSHLDLVRLEQCGFWTTGKTLPVEFKASEFTFFKLFDNRAFAVKSEATFSESLQISLLSRAGLDLAKVLKPDFAASAFADLWEVKKPGIECYLGKLNSAGEMDSSSIKRIN